MAKPTQISARQSFMSGAAAIALSGALFISPGQAFAQSASADESGLEEIVVTAQRRSENLQVVPISVTAISASTLAKTGLNSTLAITQAVPSVQLTKSGNASIFYIRGVGNASGSTGEEGANAFYIDGVYLSDIVQANAEFNNIERIEVLKGPQGTLFGRNSSGGLVNIITKTPGDKFELSGKVGYGNYDTIKGQLYVAGPLSEKISADLALTGRNQRDGWGKNIATGDDTAEGYYYGVRSKIVFRPSDSAKIVLAGDYWDSYDTFYTGFTLTPDSVGPGGFRYAGKYNRNSLNPQSAHLRVAGTSLTGEFDLGFADLTSITAYRHQKSTAYVDSDYSPNQTAELFIPSGVKAFQQELRLASNSSGPLSWQFGGFLYRAHAFVNRQTTLGTAVGGIGRGNVLDADMKTRSIAGFGEVSYDVTPTTHLTLGGRYTHETRRIHQVRAAFNPATPAAITALALDTDLIPGFQKKISFNKFTYRVALRQDISDDVNVYASYNRGFKSGIYALQSPGGPPVKPQTTDAFEIGLKSELLDRTVRFNMAGFHYKVKNYQARAAPGFASIPILLNATSVKVDGVEAELTFQPNRELQITANGTYLNSRFGKFLNAPFTYPNPSACAINPATGAAYVGGAPEGIVPGATLAGAPTGGNRTCNGAASGNKTPLSPKFAGSISMTYTIPLGDVSELRLNGIISHNSGYRFELDNRLRQPSYTLMNGSIEYRYNENWGIEFFMNNITDKQYYVTKLGSGSGDHGEFAPPRMYGVNLSFKF